MAEFTSRSTKGAAGQIAHHSYVRTNKKKKKKKGNIREKGKFEEKGQRGVSATTLTHRALFAALEQLVETEGLLPMIISLARSLRCFFVGISWLLFFLFFFFFFFLFPFLPVVRVCAGWATQNMCVPSEAKEAATAAVDVVMGKQYGMYTHTDRQTDMCLCRGIGDRGIQVRHKGYETVCTATTAYCNCMHYVIVVVVVVVVVVVNGSKRQRAAEDLLTLDSAVFPNSRRHRIHLSNLLPTTFDLTLFNHFFFPFFFSPTAYRTVLATCTTCAPFHSILLVILFQVCRLLLLKGRTVITTNWCTKVNQITTKKERDKCDAMQ